MDKYSVFIYLCFMFLFAVTDLWKRHISNWIILPAIGFGVAITGNWHWALGAFIGGMIIGDFNPKAMRFNMGKGEMRLGEHLIHGGDMKMMALTGAFCGAYSIYVVVTTAVTIMLWRMIFDNRSGIPVAPFVLIAALTGLV